MKRNLLLMAAAIILSQVVHAQQQTHVGLYSGIRIMQNGDPLSSPVIFYDSTHTGEYYLQKSKNQKTAAWVMLGGGVALTIVGTVGFTANSDLIFIDNSTADAYAFVALVGAGLSLGSIPLFIASGRNHRKAATFSFKSQPIFIPQQNSFVFKSQPAVSLVIPL